jgi:hypothetical protein
MMRLTNLSLAALCLAACATSGSQEAVTSWGKAGVPLVDYWNDAAQCALAGATADANAPTAATDLSRSGADRANPTGAANTSMRPANQPSGLEGSVDLNSTVMAARHNEALRAREEQRAREAAVNACLSGRGYQQFRLTAEQAAHLETLAEGSRERRAYLHSLASDPAILAAQGV